MKLPALKLFRTFLVAGAFLFAITPSASAQVTLVVSPPRHESDVKPGETIQQTIRVTNPSEDSQLVLKAFIQDFIVQDEKGTPIRVDVSASGRYLASPWFTLDKEELTLAPKETGEVTAIIAVPQDALPGGHYAMVLFQNTTAEDLGTSASYTTAQVGSIFSLTVEGDINYDALIKDFSVKNNVSEFGPIDFSATIENQSDTHITPQSNITIVDMFGRTLETIKLDDVNIFPFASRTLQGSWETIWGLGRYAATIDVAYGAGLNTTRTLYFWIMPWRVILAVLVLLLVLVASLISIRRHILHRQDHRDDEIEDLKRKIAELENKQN
ncbi:MAG: hypothetical protein UY18_C0022G0018 [Microgenomates group bacterium GW2011_GWF2_47_9]|nr:MAG: hypothetical protein UY18_C0022G0018 [Microgenomates group bacterium GW2011_GWF2_47_9]